jgi:peptide/nickel transport system ATP-binding protein
VPEIDPQAERHRANVTGEVPNPRNPPSGCRFHPRCSNIIPPGDWRGSQEAFRRAFQFKRRVLAGDIDPEEVVEEAGQRSIDAILERGLALELPEEHRLADKGSRSLDVAVLELPNDAEQTLRRAAEKLLDNDYDGAKTELEDEFVSVCEQDVPEMREAGSRITACHLYEDDTLVTPGTSD